MSTGNGNIQIITSPTVILMNNAPTRRRKFTSLLVLLSEESDVKFHQVASSLVV